MFEVRELAKRLAVTGVLAMSATIASAQSVDDVALAQRLLNSLGYNAGQVDGIWGQTTRNAMSQFYRQKGLTFDGTLGERELNLLLASTPLTCSELPEVCTDAQLCSEATWESATGLRWQIGLATRFVFEAQERGLQCLDGVSSSGDVAVLSNTDQLRIDLGLATREELLGDANTSCDEQPDRCSDEELCSRATWESSNGPAWQIGNARAFAVEAQVRGLTCGTELIEPSRAAEVVQDGTENRAEDLERLEAKIVEIEQQIADLKRDSGALRLTLNRTDDEIERLGSQVITLRSAISEYQERSQIGASELGQTNQGDVVGSIGNVVAEGEVSVDDQNLSTPQSIVNDRQLATADELAGIYRPAGPEFASWSCNPNDLGFDGGAVGIVDGYLEGVEYRCELTNPVSDGRGTRFTAICSAEGSTYVEPVTLTPITTGVSIQRNGFTFDWLLCDNHTFGASPNQSPTNNRWTFGGRQGVFESATRDASGNSVTFTCNDLGENGRLYVELGGEPISGGTAIFEIDGTQFTFPVWAEGGQINTECSACGGNYQALWKATAAGKLMTVISSDGRSARFSLDGSRDALGDVSCRPDDGF